MQAPVAGPVPKDGNGSGNSATASRWSAALAGLVGGAVALGVSEWLAGLASGVPSLVGSVGQAAIDWSPGSLVHLGITLLGHHDKTFVVGVILLVSALAAAELGVVASHSRWPARAGFMGFGLIGVVAASRDPQARVVEVILATALSVLAGVVTMELLLKLAPRPVVSASADPASRDQAGGSPSSRRVPSWQPGWRPSPQYSRRVFLAAAAAGGALGAIAAAGGRRLATQAVAASRRLVNLPPVADPVPAPTPANSVSVPGVTPIVVSNGDFYRIDTRLLGPPSVDVGSWRLRITGKVDRPQVFTWDDVAAMPMVEEYVTLQCVSNEVGGNLVGNAAWRGVPLTDFLNMAGIHPDADQIVGRSVDGFTVGFPTSAAFDGRIAMVAVGMNGELLPSVHGFPARLIIAGLYGYVSATKWLTEIELTRFDAYDSYWVQRGWDRMGPIKTESRIDTIAPNPPVAGPAVLAGVAWAPTRGISKVEVQVDNEPWGVARLAEPLSDDTWRQWSFPWTATAGSHVIRVRATDGRGQTQTAVKAEPLPNAATGYHTVSLNVRK